MHYTNLLLFPICLFFSSLSFAFFSTMDTGDILAPSQYTFTSEAQMVSSGEDGGNFRFHLDQAFDDSSQWRLTLGTGVNNYQASALFKWVPIPDYEQQPAIGLIGGLSFVELNNQSLVALQLKALVSKNFVTEYGYVSPYASLNLAFELSNVLDGSPAQLVAGSRYRSEDWQQSFILAELGFEISNAFSYLSIGFQYDFHDAALPQLQP